MRLPSRRRAERRRRFGSAAWLAGGGLVLVVSARTLNAAPLLLPGVGLVLLGVLACVWAVVAAVGADVRRSAVPRRVTEDDLFPVTIEVSGRYLGPAEVTVRDPLSPRALRVGRGSTASAPSDHARSRVAAVDPAARGERRGPLAAVTRRRVRRVQLIAPSGPRGRRELPAPEVALGDPLGLAQVRLRGGGASDELLVLPRVEPVRWVGGGRGRVVGDDGSSREPTGAGEVDGLREYRRGTPATRIHWPALARGAGLLERRLVAATATLPLVVLDGRCVDSSDGRELLDAVVRAAASLTRELAAIGGCTLLLPGSRLPLGVARDLRAWPGLHTQLALVEPELDPRRTPALRPEHINGPLFYVTTSPALEPPWLRRHAPNAVLVSPIDADDSGAGASFEVAGCRGYPLSARIVRRAA